MGSRRIVRMKLNKNTSSSLPPADSTAAKIGAVQYLNTKPLVHGLGSAKVDLQYDLPSRLADKLALRHLDVALIPSIELFRSGILRHSHYKVVSNACIGSHGPVMSVKLFFRTAPHKVQSLAVDEGSRTSSALAQILLSERYDVTPSVHTLPLGSHVWDTSADCVLLIGDRALSMPQRGQSFQLVWDLGDEWSRWTHLPFVFAVWAAHPDYEYQVIEPLLQNARDNGQSNLAAIAAAEAAGHGLTVPQCLSYLQDNLHYTLGIHEMKALFLFYELASKINLAPNGLDLDSFFSQSHLYQ